MSYIPCTGVDSRKIGITLNVGCDWFRMHAFCFLAASKCLLTDSSDKVFKILLISE